MRSYALVARFFPFQELPRPVEIETFRPRFSPVARDFVVHFFHCRFATNASVRVFVHSQMLMQEVAICGASISFIVAGNNQPLEISE